MDPAEVLITTWGPAGAIIVALGGSVFWLARMLFAVQRARVEDAQKYVTAILDIAEKWNGTLGELTRVTDRLAQSVERRSLGRPYRE